MRARYVAGDHKRHLQIEYPDGLVPPMRILLEEGNGTWLTFWYDPQLGGFGRDDAVTCRKR